MRNNKGFTLIELLAVIAILAVIMLIGGQSVFGAMEQARKGSFKTEVTSAIQAAKNAYQVDLMNQAVAKKKICYSIAWLKTNGYYEKSGNDAADYVGSVEVSTTNIGAGTASYKVWMSNKQYYVANGTLDNIKTSGTGDGAIINKVNNASALCGVTTKDTTNSDYR